MLPPAPATTCMASESEKDAFYKRIEAFNKAYDDYIVRWESGSSPSSMTEKEKDKSVKQALKQSDLNMDELMALQNMSEEEQQKWAMQYAARMEKNKNVSQSQNLTKLFMKKQEIMDQLELHMERVVMDIHEFQNIKIAENKKLDEKLNPIKVELQSIETIFISKEDEARVMTLLRQEYELKKAFCEKMSPLWLAVINKRLAYTKKAIHLWIELAEVENQISLQQTGFKAYKDVNYPGIKEVAEYAKALENSYDYWVGPFRH